MLHTLGLMTLIGYYMDLFQYLCQYLRRRLNPRETPIDKAMQPPIIKGVPYRDFLRVKADFWSGGAHAKADWRYMAMAMFLKLSPSAQAVYAKLKGIPCSLPLPADYDLVEPVVKDFMAYMDIDESDEDAGEQKRKWWRQEGKHLFGTPAPAPNVRVFEPITEAYPGIRVRWDRNDCLVAQIPLGQTLTTTMRQLKAKLAKHKFADTPPKRALPKYTFQPSKIREATLAEAQVILAIYIGNQKLPLWWIGNCFNILPWLCFDEKKAAKLSERELSEAKELISVATSRLLLKAKLVAENAARGRFPCTKMFPEAQINAHKRKRGRPRKGS